MQKNYEKKDERILVVKRDRLFANGAWHGIHVGDTQKYVSLIDGAGEFQWRSAMETDTQYKQIIPYLVFAYEDKIFIMQRRSDSSEQRLRNKMSIGIGGHMRQEDMQEKDIFAWARREFHEEVAYNGSFKIETIGIVNDDTNDVGKVHIGLVLLLRGDSSEISVKSELKHGQMLSLSECEQYYDQMEGWSQLVFDSLRTKLQSKS